MSHLFSVIFAIANMSCNIDRMNTLREKYCIEDPKNERSEAAITVTSEGKKKHSGCLVITKIIAEAGSISRH